MKTRIIKNKNLFNYPICLQQGIPYKENHAYKTDHGWTLFVGWIHPKGSTEVIVHDSQPSEISILCMQVILSYGLKVSSVKYRSQLQRIVANKPRMTMDDFCSMLHTGPSWIIKTLGLRMDIPLKKIVLCNSIALSRIKGEIPEHFLKQAETLDPLEFIPMVQKYVRESSVRGSK